MLSKKEFPKKTRIVNAKNDWGLDYEIEFEVWQDPSRAVVSDLFRIVLFTNNTEFKEQSIDQQRKDAKAYFEAVSQCFLDCSIDGASFDTVDDVERTFEMPNVAWGFWYDAVAAYCAELLETSAALKKIRELVKSPTTSGDDSKNEERK